MPHAPAGEAGSVGTTSPAGDHAQGPEERRTVSGQPRTDALIDIRGVKLTYETKGGRLPVLDGVDMQVPEGGFVAVVGPSGCGKSTLTRLIAGLLEPNAGEVWLHGQRVTGPKSSVGVAFQNPVLLEWRSVLRNVTLPLELVATRMPKREKEERARQLLTLVGLEGFEDKRPSELSGGMRQRASLCRSIVHKPEVLILDEPFGALDAFTREDLWQTMQKVKSEEPFTGVMITHDLRESIFLADTVIVLSGRPAFTQYTMEVPWRGERDLDLLYTPEGAEMLGELRNQIQIAQGRAPREAGV